MLRTATCEGGGSGIGGGKYVGVWIMLDVMSIDMAELRMKRVLVVVDYVDCSAKYRMGLSGRTLL